MTKIIVEGIDKLSKYGDDLNDDALEFDRITKKMKSIVQSLSSAWSGYDSQKFISNANNYLTNLRQVKTSLINTSIVIKNQTLAYNRRIDEFNQKIGGNKNG